MSRMEVNDAGTNSSAPQSKKRSSVYPDPLIVEPKAQHSISFIILHGRGSNAETFGPPLLATKLPNGRDLTEELPNARFIFPTASFRRAKVFKRIPITQWFDNFSLEDPSVRQELQSEGLRETAQFIHQLIKREIDAVGSRNVFLGGLSQGCAAALISLAIWAGPTLGGLFGMSGWLPMQSVLLSGSSLEELDEEESGIGFEFDTGIKDDGNESVLCPLFEELDLEFVNTKELFKTPIFLGHGCEDEKVTVDLGRSAASCLSQIGCDVQWHEYEGLAHWYHGQELQEILDWIKEQKSTLGEE